MYFSVNFWQSSSLAQFELVNLISLLLELELNGILKSRVPTKCWKIWMTKTLTVGAVPYNRTRLNITLKVFADITFEFEDINVSRAHISLRYLVQFRADALLYSAEKPAKGFSLFWISICRSSLDPLVKHFSSPREILKTISTSRLLHIEPERAWEQAETTIL